jgi:hypothetical protein
MRIATIALVIMTITGCRYHPASIPVSGDVASIAHLTGTWVGEYTGRESGRSGSITFIMEAAGDSAFGDVLMIPQQAGDMLRAVDVDAGHVQHVRSPQALRIDFVQVAGAEVRGVLEPYIAPDCHCQVTTTFTGIVDDKAIEGTFVTRGPGGLEQHGRWRVVRDRP